MFRFLVHVLIFDELVLCACMYEYSNFGNFLMIFTHLEPTSHLFACKVFYVMGLGMLF